ncbi:MAG: 30S ribosomal protein S6 [Saprospiraceae bacterium]
MRHYEVTFLVDPVLSGEEVKSAAEHIQSELKGFGATIVAVDEMGLRPLAYQINRRSSGVYFCIEFSTVENTGWLGKLELNMKRDERLLRFLTVRLDKYGIKYNDDKRNGRIGKRRAEEAAALAAASAPQTGVVDLDEEVIAV